MKVIPSIYTHHPRLWQSNSYVYPVISRRSKGLSIGVNLNPDKACNFDCVYCCVDRSDRAGEPKRSTVEMPVLRDELDAMLQIAISGELFQQPPFDSVPRELRRINDVAFSGDGEPTSFKGFGDACALAAELLKRHQLPDVKIIVITNATLLHRPKVAEALKFLDDHNGEIWAKLDAGTQEYYALVERTSIPLSRVLDNIAEAGRVRPIVIQSLFMNINGEPPSSAEIAAYVQRLRDLLAGGCRIKLVQVYTVARGPAESFVTPLPAPALDAIADQVKSADLPVETFYGPT